MPVSGPMKPSMIRNSVSTSASLRAAVGSSMIRTLELNESALAISSSCWEATVSFPTWMRGSILTPSLSRSSAASLLSFLWSRRPPGSRGSRPMNMFCAAVRWFIRKNSWWMTLMPACWAASGVGRVMGSPRIRTSPSSGW